jgi:hypothetical protein
MSQIYASGNRTTAIANIIAQVNSLITYDTAGVKVLDSQGLAEWLRSEFNTIDTTDGTPPSSAAEVQKAVDAVAMGPMVQSLAKLFGASHWSGRPDWPVNVGQFQGNKATAAQQEQRALQAAAHALQNQYETIKQKLIDSIPNEYDIHVVPRLPTPVVRDVETRAYVATYVTDWGEESAPSAPSDLVDLDGNDTVSVTVPAAPVGRNVTHFRLYRSNSGNTGAAYQYVPNPADDVGFPIGTLTVTDDRKDEHLQETCPSLTWEEPPETLTGLIGLPNGIMLGFVGARICACEPYQPYAWPTEYQLTMEFPYVGAGVFGQTAVVLTTGNPYYVSGADSANLSVQKIESNQSCVSKRSVASGEGGVFWASPDGICLASPSGVQVITEGAYSRDDWTALNPANSFGAFHEGVYYLFLAVGVTVAVDLKSRRISTIPFIVPLPSAAYTDLLTDTLYVARNTELVPLFRGTGLTGTWKSRVFVAAQHPGFSAIRVESDFESAVTVKLYGDGVLRHTATFTSREPQRLPAGRYRDHEMQVEAACRVTRVTLATSIAELGAV